jgi:hypothetical protein
MSTAITAFGTSEWLLLISHGVRLTGHSGAALYDRLSRTCCCLLGVGRSLGMPDSGKNPLSHFEWCLIALAISFFRPSSRVGLVPVWERGVRVLHLDPLEIVDERSEAAVKRMHAL